MGFCGPLLAGANSSLLYWQPAAIEARGFYPSTLNLGSFLATNQRSLLPFDPYFVPWFGGSVNNCILYSVL